MLKFDSEKRLDPLVKLTYDRKAKIWNKTVVLP